ncbi:MAG: hypothetical protein ACRC4L_02050 [Mycoplasma sp.]
MERRGVITLWLESETDVENFKNEVFTKYKDGFIIFYTNEKVKTRVIVEVFFDDEIKEQFGMWCGIRFIVNRYWTFEVFETISNC